MAMTLRFMVVGNHIFFSISVEMAMTPRFMVVGIEGKGYLKYVSESEVFCGSDESVFNPLVKIEAETAKVNKDFFHLRFSHTNRYWGRGADSWLVANSKQPEEDISNPSCTLFQYIGGGFQHIQSGGFVRIIPNGYRMYIANISIILRLTVLDWETFVKLPEHVAFKGYNGSYLGAVWAEGHPYLQFASDDPNKEISGYEVQLMPDGYARIKSDHFGKFWRRSPNWIWADSTDGGAGNHDTLFWPFKLEGNTIALRNKGNNYCKALSVEGKTNCLNAAVSTITNEAKMEVEELVLDRQIYNVTYHMEYARIFDEQPFLAGTTTAVNNGDQEASISVEISYEDEASYSFTRGFSLTAGVTTTIEVDVLSIVKGSVQTSFSISGAFEWNNTTTTRKSVKATGAVPVPPRSSAVIRYVGTRGRCDVPFSYTQKDRSSTTGQSGAPTKQTDGIFNGVNCYNFNFEFAEIKSLST